MPFAATNQSARELWVCQLGSVPYLDALSLQERVQAHRQGNELPDSLLLLEHPPVYTRGRRSAEGELPLGEGFYRSRQIEIIDTNRGGRITYHGPGQLVGYPIMRIADIGRYLRTMESAIVAALADEGIRARSRHLDGPDYTGVWVEDRKIASIGVHVSRGVTTHGFAVNVENDLDPFSWIVPCGLPDVAMTSVARELTARASTPATVGSDQPDPGSTGSLDCFRKRIAHRFAEAHQLRQRLVSPRQLGIAVDDRQAVGA